MKMPTRTDTRWKMTIDKFVKHENVCKIITYTSELVSIDMSEPNQTFYTHANGQKKTPEYWPHFGKIKKLNIILTIEFS